MISIPLLLDKATQLSFNEEFCLSETRHAGRAAEGGCWAEGRGSNDYVNRRECVNACSCRSGRLQNRPRKDIMH